MTAVSLFFYFIFLNLFLFFLHEFFYVLINKFKKPKKLAFTIPSLFESDYQKLKFGPHHFAL